jgi:peptidoglycan/LPS O-acetylase OafA/YrhL
MDRRRLDSLEFVRAACALLVLFDHVYGESRDVPQYAPLVALASFGEEAVIGFFVLSGCVISLQQYRDTGRYLRARLVRLLPIYLTLLVFSALAMIACGVQIGLSHFVATALFADTLYSDSFFPLRFFVPSWSLAYELYYYIAFIAIMTWPRLVLPLFATSVAVGLAMYFITPHSEAEDAIEHAFSFFCMWLSGVLVTGLVRRKYTVSIATGAWALTVGLCLSRVPFSEPSKFDFIRLLGYSIGFSVFIWSLVSDHKDNTVRRFDLGLPARLAIAALVLPYVWELSTSHFSMKAAVSAVLVIFTLAPRRLCEAIVGLVRPIMPFMVYVGGLSYALYLVHYPLVQTFNILSPLPGVVNIAIITLLSFAAAHFLDYRFQPWVRARLIPGKPAQSSS